MKRALWIILGLALVAAGLFLLPQAAVDHFSAAASNILEQHFGAFCAVALSAFLVSAYVRGEAPAFYKFLHELATDSRTGMASTKNVGYLSGLAVLCWSFAKVTLATCRRIDQVGGLDPTTVFLAELGIIAALVGIVKGMAMRQGGDQPAAPAPPSGAPPTGTP